MLLRPLAHSSFDVLSFGMDDIKFSPSHLGQSISSRLR
jgi:hypothetical protein